MKKVVGKARRPTKPRGQRPVIAVRVTKSILQQMREAAKKSGRSMSEEMESRLSATFQVFVAVPPGHHVHPDGQVSPNPPDRNERIRKLISGEAQGGEVLYEFTDWEVENVRRAMRAVGFTQIPDYLGGYWAEPGVTAVPLKESFMRELKTVIADAIAGAREK